MASERLSQKLVNNKTKMPSVIQRFLSAKYKTGMFKSIASYLLSLEWRQKKINCNIAYNINFHCRPFPCFINQSRTIWHSIREFYGESSLYSDPEERVLRGVHNCNNENHTQHNNSDARGIPGVGKHHSHHHEAIVLGTRRRYGFPTKCVERHLFVEPWW